MCNHFFKILTGYVSFIVVVVLLTATTVATAQPTGFVTRQDSAEVVIVDLSDGTVLGTIPTLDTSPFEIALSPDASTLYATHAGRGEDAVNILDVASASPLQRVGVASTPIEVALLPDGSKLYTADFLAGTVSVVDTASATNVATIPTAFLSYDVAAAPDGTRVFATALSATALFVIDTATDVVVDQIPIGRNFLGHVAITPDGQKAYVTEFRNQVTVIDLASRTVIGSIPFNAAGANPNNGALDIEIDPQGAFAYVLGFDTVNVIDLAIDTLVATIPIGIQLSDVAIDSSGTFVYVTTLHQTIPEVSLNEIVKIETTNFTIQDRFVIGGLLVGLAVEPSTTAQGLKQDAITELDVVKAAILGGAPGVGDVEDAVKNLDDAIASLQASLGSFQPSDPNRLIAALGEAFFADEEDAVEDIFDAIDNGEITDTAILDELQNIVVNKILEADKIIAETAIDDAIAAGGGPEDISNAEAEFATAEQQVADGVAAGIIALEFFDDAVGSFEDAWENAQEAVEQEEEDDDDEDDDDDDDDGDGEDDDD